MQTRALLILALLGTLATAIHHRSNPLHVNEPNDLGVEQLFDQLLDHSQPTSNVTWKQRVTVYNATYNATNGTAILYICGEWTCNGVGGATFVLTLAERYNAIVFAVEHRFYGSSQPMGYGEDSQSTQSYEKYLTVQQALDDLAYFITETSQKGLNGVLPDTPWITIGGSYPGALSAWFRYKYPHLSVGSLASSGVIEAILEFYEFDQQVAQSASKSGQNCPDMIDQATQLAEKMTKQPVLRKQLMKSFGTEFLSDGEFFNVLSDTIAQKIQYGQRTVFCAQLKDKSPQEALNVMVQILQVVDTSDYTVVGLRNSTYNKNKAGRQWLFQTCSELAYFQTAPLSGQSLRSPTLDIQFFKTLCSDVFGKNRDGNDFWANVDNTNAYLGGDKLNVKNLIMTNGSEDPWKQASIFEPNGSDIEVIQIDCDDCGHCSDTKKPQDSDPQAVKDARSRIIQLFDQWIGTYKNTTQYMTIQK